VLLDIDGETLSRTYESLASPGNTLALNCDVSDPDGAPASMTAIKEHFGRLDALVNNAGIAIFKPLRRRRL
jgi:NAD(P)-dependent dehydrogenase (short-subunit alcohol dehydrogenase family)